MEFLAFMTLGLYFFFIGFCSEMGFRFGAWLHRKAVKNGIKKNN